MSNDKQALRRAASCIARHAALLSRKRHRMARYRPGEKPRVLALLHRCMNRRRVGGKKPQKRGT